MSATTNGSDRPVDPQEYFARVLDNGPREPGQARPAGGDDAFAEELDLVARLRMLGDRGEPTTVGEPRPAPTAEERARMRARVMGSMSAGAATSPPAQPSRATERGRSRWGFSRVMAAAVCLLIAVSGASVLFSGDALPGDPLYGIKRTMERASLTFSFGEKSSGFTHLELAGNRVDEIETLARRDSPSEAGLVVDTFDAFRADAAAGSRALTRAGTNAAESVLGSLQRWSTHERGRIIELRADLPAAARPAAVSAIKLLHGIIGRTDALRNRFPCRSITSGARDELGPLPATGPCRYSPETVNRNASQTPIPPDKPAPQPPGNDRAPHRQVLAVSPPDPQPAPEPAAQPIRVRNPVPDPPTGGDVPPPSAEPGHGDSSVTVPLPVDLGSLDVAGLLSVDLG